MGESYIAASGASVAGGRAYVPSWAPSPGVMVQISYAAGTHPDGVGATLEEIDPKYQSWNPDAPSQGPYGSPPSILWGNVHVYCGCVLNNNTRQLVHYGSGHSAINVCAPFVFDLDRRRWQWIDVPLPFDAFQAILDNGVPIPPSQANMEVYYPAAQYDYMWGDIQGGWSGWVAGFERNGIIQPVPGHSRAGLCHISAKAAGNAKGSLLMHVSPTGKLGGINASASHLFDHETRTWSRNANSKGAGGTSNGSGTVFDPVTSKVVVFGAGETSSTSYHVFDIQTRTWSLRTASIGVSLCTDTGGNLLHAAARLHISPGSVNDAGTPTWTGTKYRFWATDIDAIVGSGTFAPAELNVSVQGTWPLHPSADNRYIGWNYCPLDKCLYAVTGASGTGKYWRLAPPPGAVTQNDYLTGTWTLTDHTLTSGTFVSSINPVFVYQRLQWDRASSSFIWHSGYINDPVFALRPAAL